MLFFLRSWNFWGGWIPPAVLEDGGFVYAGSGIESSRLCMNKAEAKEAVSLAGLTVARDLRFQSPDSVDAEEAVNKLGQQMV